MTITMHLGWFAAPVVSSTTRRRDHGSRGSTVDNLAPLRVPEVRVA